MKRLGLDWPVEYRIATKEELESKRYMGIDPGLRGCGIAIFKGPWLERAWYQYNSERVERGPKAWADMGRAVNRGLEERGFSTNVDVLCIEYPQVYKTRWQKGDQDDIIQLAAATGSVSRSLDIANKFGVVPVAWKGNVPKPVHNGRVMKRLTEEEKGLMESCPENLRNNLIDAVGLGLYIIGRAGLKRGTGHIFKPWTKGEEGMAEDD